MTAPSGMPRHRPVLTLTGLGLLMVLAVATDVGAFSWVQANRMRAEARAMSSHSADMPALFAALSHRASTLREGVESARNPIPSAPEAQRTLARAMRDTLMQLGNRASPGLFARVPASMRQSLGKADDLAASLQMTLLEYAGLLELGRVDRARARAVASDSIGDALQLVLAQATQHGVEDLAARERDLQAAAVAAAHAVRWWLIATTLLLVLCFLGLWWRVAAPSLALRDALVKLEAGDLGVRIPVARYDELGRLIEHFNQTTAALQSRAHEQGRLAAAGELVAGVAHEINNPLMAIATICENQLHESGLSATRREESEQVLRQSQRAAKLASGLLRFVRPGADRPESVDVNAVVLSSLDLLDFRFPKHEIQVQRELPDGLPFALINATRLEQVMVNLFGNAIDALTGVATPRRLWVTTSAEGGFLRVVVQDGGAGIPPEIRSRLFQPFASSKGRRGNGLGLYMSREILRAAGGDLTLQPGDYGACFLVTVPLAPEGVPAHSPAPEVRASVPVPAVMGAGAALPGSAAPAGPLQGVRVLIAEDELPLRKPMARFLRHSGAVVIEVGDGKAALERLQTESVDVVVTDLRMPRMDGAELYRRIKHRHPDLEPRVLLLSGDPSQLGELMETAVAERVVPKPVAMVELVKRIADLASARSVV